MSFCIIVVGVILAINGLMINAGAETAMHQIIGSVQLSGGLIVAACGMIYHRLQMNAHQITKVLRTAEHSDPPIKAMTSPSDASSPNDRGQLAKLLEAKEAKDKSDPAKYCPACGYRNPITTPVCRCGTTLT